MITCLKTELHKSGYVGFKFWQVDRVAGTARIFLAYVSPHLPKRGRVRLQVGYPISYGGRVIHGRQQESSRGSEKWNERNSFYSPTLVGKSYGEDTVLWLEEIKARAGARTQLERYTPRSHTATVTHRGFIFRFHFPRAKGHVIKILQSAYGNQSTSFERSCTHGWRMVSKEGESTPSSFVYSKGIHTFLERKARKNTWPFMRLTEVKERARVSEEQKKNSIIGERCTWRRGSGVKTRSKF